MGTSPDPLAVVAPVLALLALVAYGWGLLTTRRRGWPPVRVVLWVAGLAAGTLAVSGPLADRADKSFVAHAVAHVLLGMLAPLLLAQAAPVALLLRALPVQTARRLSRVLASPLAAVPTEPVVAALLDVGGLWVLYTSGLYPLAQRHQLLHVLVHIHVFLAGYLFTVALVGVDPLPHRRSFPHRAAVLVLALAAHDILCKYLYAHPLAGVPAGAVKTGAMIMYYGGDAVALALIVLLCARWYSSTRPRELQPRYAAGARSLSRE